MTYIASNVESTFNNYYHDYESCPYTYCCEESIDKDVNFEFKSVVDMDKLCIAQSLFAGPDRRFPTPQLLQAFKDNHNMVEGVKWQFFGTEEGMQYVFPSVESGDCDNFDPRFRYVFIQYITI